MRSSRRLTAGAAAAADAAAADVKTTASHPASGIALKVQDINATNQSAGDTIRRRINLLYVGRKQKATGQKNTE